MPRMSPWTVAAICATVAFGCVHALVDVLMERKRAYALFPRGWGQW